ncbi:MAG: hypothetical protein Q8O67_00375 [Deltaproteobacteria bacterium]|nr:hypothetical protein [Deltaproteobacteria bacterium]
MIRAGLLVLSALAVSLGGGGCTLLLPTGELIKPCVEQADCDDGFLCEDEACLPEDEGEANVSE